MPLVGDWESYEAEKSWENLVKTQSPNGWIKNRSKENGWGLFEKTVLENKIICWEFNVIHDPLGISNSSSRMPDFWH
jgi:hypothetical protein